MSSTKTAITYNEEMVKHRCLWDPNYPECPERFSHVLKRCDELGLISRCQRIPSREASTEEILAKHSPETITLLEESQNKNVEEMEELSSRYDSIYICSETFKLAKMAVGSTIDLVKEICEGNVRNGMAIVRPPGHHAMKSTYCGYCFFNNVALAADYALKNCNVSKILIVDWDVHHGQATQQMFYDDKRVLYFSIHRYEYGTFWPNLRESDYDYIGDGSGLGYNFNVPLNKVGFGNSEYLAIFHELLLPVAIEFEPDVVLVSGGYDAAIGDEKGLMKVEPACYAHLINSLKRLANGKVAVVLEGGYFLKSLSEGAALTLRSLLGDPCPKIEPLHKPDDNLIETVRNVICSHRPYWKCFQIYDSFSPSKLPLPSNCHIPSIRFEYDEEPLQIFPTKEFYPVVLEDMKLYYNDWLDDLIESTNLNVPKHHYALISDRNENGIWLDYVIQDVQKNGNWDTELFLNMIKTPKVDWEIGEAPKIGDQHQNENTYAFRSIFQAIQLTEAKLARSVFIENNQGQVELSSCLKVVNQHFNKSNVKRIVVMDFHYEGNQSVDVADNVLLFRFTNNENNVINVHKKNLIEFGWENCSKSWQYLILWTKVVLPICYEFGPDLIFILIDFEIWSKHFPENHARTELLGCLLHWVSSLAGGKCIIVTKQLGNEFASILNDGREDKLDPGTLDNLDKINFVKDSHARLAQHWECVGDFVKYLIQH